MKYALFMQSILHILLAFVAKAIRKRGIQREWHSAHFALEFSNANQ